MTYTLQTSDLEEFLMALNGSNLVAEIFRFYQTLRRMEDNNPEIEEIKVLLLDHLSEKSKNIIFDFD